MCVYMRACACRKPIFLSHTLIIIASTISHIHSYYHEFFLRGRADLCRFMVRTRVKGIGMKAASSPATEPNFNLYPTCPVKGPLQTTTSCRGGNNHDDDDASAASHKTQEHVVNRHTCHDDQDDDDDEYNMSNIPNIISPPESPVMSSASLVQVPDLLPSCLLNVAAVNKDEQQDDDNVMVMDSTIMPHTGDEVFFEGQQFCYLDHLDLDDIQEINVTNVEYL